MKNRTIFTFSILLAAGVASLTSCADSAHSSLQDDTYGQYVVKSDSADNNSTSYVEDETNIRELYNIAEEEAHSIVDPIIDANAQTLENRGISVETAKKAVIRTDNDDYILFIGGCNITIDVKNGNIDIQDDSAYFGDGPDGSGGQALYDSVSEAIVNSEDALSSLDASFDDIWHEVNFGEYGIRKTDKAGVYTIKYQNYIILVNTVNESAALLNSD